MFYIQHTYVHVPISETEKHPNVVWTKGQSYLVTFYEAVSLISCKLGLHRSINVHPEIR